MSETICERHGQSCPSYRAGHTVHFIQARKVSEFLDYFPERCRPVEITDLGDGHFSTVIDGKLQRGWNHWPERVTEFAEESRHGLVQYIPYSGVLISARLDEAGRVTGRQIINPSWGDGKGPEAPDLGAGGVDRKCLYARAVETAWNCDTDAAGHGTTGGVDPRDLPTGDLDNGDFIPVRFGTCSAGHAEILFPDGTVRTAYHCDYSYMMIFYGGHVSGGIFYHPVTGLLVTGRPEHRKFLSISWTPLAPCSRSEQCDRQRKQGLEILERHLHRTRDDGE